MSENNKSGADPGNFVRGGPTFQKLKQEKKNQKKEEGRKRKKKRRVVVVLSFCRRNRLSRQLTTYKLFSVGHGLLYNCKPLSTQAIDDMVVL